MPIVLTTNKRHVHVRNSEAQSHSVSKTTNTSVLNLATPTKCSPPAFLPAFATTGLLPTTATLVG